MLHDTLWQANLDLAEACLTHPFVRALGDGSLDADRFRCFIAQDAFFLHAFLKAYAVALAQSEPAEITAVFHELIGGVLEELKLHRAYAAQLGIDLEQVVPSPACRAYTDFLLRTAWHASLGETVAAMTPCMRLYAFLGGKLAGKCGPDHPYRLWIETYSGEEFGRLAGRLETLLDRVSSDTRFVRDTYRYALQCELDFFSDAGRERPLLR
jgi:thiaminase/transcriptional activator TenA